MLYLGRKHVAIHVKDMGNLSKMNANLARGKVWPYNLSLFKSLSIDLQRMVKLLLLTSKVIRPCLLIRARMETWKCWFMWLKRRKGGGMATTCIHDTMFLSVMRSKAAQYLYQPYMGYAKYNLSRWSQRHIAPIESRDMGRNHRQKKKRKMVSAITSLQYTLKSLETSMDRWKT